MKRILLLNTYFRPHYGGVETTLYHIAVTLKKSGHDPVVVTSDRGTNGASCLAAFEVIDGIPVHRYHLPRRKWLLNTLSIADEYWRAGELARRLHKESAFHGVLARTHVAGLGALSSLERVPFLYLPPAVVWIQNAPALVNRSGGGLRRALRWLNTSSQLPLHAAIQRRLLRRAARVWVFSDAMRTQVGKARAEAPLRIVQPGVDLGQFRPAPENERRLLRAQRGASDGDLVALGLARLVPQKGFDAAVEALAGLPRESRWILWLVGDGPESSLLRAQAQRLGVADRVKFFPPTSEPGEWYSAADLFLMTSRYEPFGQTLLEAQASGLPVAGFLRDDAAGILNANAEVVRNGETGWLVPFGGEELGRLMRGLETGALASGREESARARAWVESRFTWERFCAELLAEFEGCRL